MINKLIAKIISLLPENLVWIFSKRYIAGKELNEAVKIIQDFNLKGIETTIDVLGEYIKKTYEALDYKQQYLKAIDVIVAEKLQTTISVKPSMFGLLLDEEFCYLQLLDLVKKANKHGLLICMDMEDSSCTDIELKLFERLYKAYPENVTLVLQAYLKRTINDLKWLKGIMLPDYPINIRICKGIYIEPEEIAFQKYNEVNDNYLLCSKFLLENGFFAALATHDKRLVKSLMHYVRSNSIPTERYEFQMLYGVRPKLRDKIVKHGHPMRIYVPYGNHWYGYSTRRLKENPRMITHIIKALLIRG